MDRMPGEILVDLGEDCRAQVLAEMPPEHGEHARRRDQHDASRLVGSMHEPESRGSVAGKLVLAQFMSIGSLDRAGGRHGVLDAARPIRSLLCAGRIGRSLPRLLKLQAGQGRVTSEKHRLAGVTYDHPGIMRNAQIHGSSSGRGRGDILVAISRPAFHRTLIQRNKAVRGDEFDGAQDTARCIVRP